MQPLNTNIELDNYLNDSENTNDGIHVTLPTDKIQTNSQARKQFVEIKELAETIKEHGQIQDIVITPADENGLHTIIAGERRWRACKLLGIDVSCKIQTGDDKKNTIIQLIENTDRNDLTFDEIGFQLDLIQKDNEFNINELANAVKKDVSYVSRHLKVINAGDEFLGLCKEAKIKSIYIADDLEKIYKKNPKVAKRLVKKGVTRELLKEHLKKLKAGINTRVSKKRKQLIPQLARIDSEGMAHPVKISSINEDSSIATEETGLNIAINELRVIGFEYV